MRAKAVYRLIVGLDTVEVVDIADGEGAVLLWDLRESQVPRFARRLREELNTSPPTRSSSVGRPSRGRDDL